MPSVPKPPLFLRALIDPAGLGWPENPFLRLHAISWISLDPSEEAQALVQEIWKGLPAEAQERARASLGLNFG